MNTNKQVKIEHERDVHNVCFDLSLISIFKVGLNSRVFDANNQACKNLATTHEDLCGMSIFDFDPTLAPEIMTDCLQELFKSNSQIFETTFQRKDGVRLPVEIWISAT